MKRFFIQVFLVRVIGCIFIYKVLCVIWVVSQKSFLGKSRCDDGIFEGVLEDVFLFFYRN